MARNAKEFTLGTANFSLPYGIAQIGQNLPSPSVEEILGRAIELGIHSLDTATTYKTEAAIGDLWPNSIPCNLTTKLSIQDCESSVTMRNSIENSLKKLKRDSFGTILIHNSSVLFDDASSHVIETLREFIYEGKTDKVGVSAYEETEILLAKSLMPEMTVFHIPENICDRRKYSSPNFVDMAKNGNSFYVRSVFLQGLLLMDLDQIPINLERVKGVLNDFHEFAKEQSLSVIQVCITYALSIPWASGIVVGVDSARQLTQVKSAFDQLVSLNIAEWPLLDEWSLDPRNWS